MSGDRLAYSIAEVAAMLGVSDDAIGDEIRAGHLVAHKLRRTTRIFASDLAAYCRSRSKVAPVVPKALTDKIVRLPSPSRPSDRRVERLLSLLPEAAP